MSESRVSELEIKVAFLEKHVEEQDRVMFSMANRLDVLERHLRRLNDSMKALDARGNGPEGAPVDERPPHY